MASTGRARAGLAALAVAGTVGAGSVGLALAPGAPKAQAEELSAFSDCAELSDYLTAQARELAATLRRGSSWPWLGGGRINAQSSEGPAEGPAADAAGGSASSAEGGGGLGEVGNGPSGTNVQEKGVDEPDRAKSDGRLVITVSGGRLHVVDTGGTSGRSGPRLTGSVTLPTPLPSSGFDGGGGQPGGGSSRLMPLPAPEQAAELLLLPGKALVIRQGWSAPSLTRPSTEVTLVDLGDPAAPRVLASDRIEGSYLSARLRDGVVRLVVQAAPDLTAPLPKRPEDWLPHRFLRDGEGRTVGEGPVLPCSAVRHDATPSGLGLLSVLTYDTTAAEPLRNPHASAVLAGGDLVYAAADRLYVATTAGGRMPCTLDACIQGGPGERDEPALRLRAGPVTRIHAFDTTRRDGTPYLASGTVTGYPLNRWAFSEYEGRLRVATTRAPADAMTPAADSAVVVLERRGNRLAEVGRVEGLGKGEQVRGVRWFGALAAVVTFRQTDPLYLLDVSDPARPRVLGVLKIPGYSAYLHPLGDGLLLGIGQDADEEGGVRGAQVSVFDVRDPSRPRRVDTLAFPQSLTTVEEDSRAFTYLPGRRLAVLPLQEYGDGRSSSSAVAVAVGTNGQLIEAGRHSADVEGPVARVVPVGERLAAVTAESVSLLDPEGLRMLGTVRLPR